MKERLTNKINDNLSKTTYHNCNAICAKQKSFINKGCLANGCGDCEHFSKIIERLAEYEDLEEQGLLVRLPCKIGDKVYHIYRKSFGDYVVGEETVYGYEYDNDGIGWRLRLNTCSPAVSLIGDNIFFSCEEAEKRLKELKGEKQ